MTDAGRGSEAFEALHAALADRRDDLADREGLDDAEAARAAYRSLLSSVGSRLGVAPPEDDRLDSREVAPPPALSDLPVEETLRSTPNAFERLYERLVSGGAYRREQGQFFTPPELAAFMASFLPDAPASVLDPACGPGAFLEAVSDRFGVDPRVVAIEKDPLMLYAARVRMALVSGEAGIEYRREDFLADSSPEPFDAVICNPPYNKFHAHDNGLVAEFDERFDTSVGRLANLYALFFLRASEFVADGGAVVFVTPSEFLHTGYGEALKGFLLEEFDVEAFVRLDWEAGAFDALTTACVTVLRRREPAGDVGFYVSESPADLDAIEDLGERGRVSAVPQGELDPEEKWTRHFSAGEVSEYLDATVPLGELADVKRGIATGHNEFFTLSPSEVEEWGLGDEHLTPVLSKATQAPHLTFTEGDFEALEAADADAFLLYYTGGEPSDALEAYVEHGEELGAHERYLTRNRDPWYAMEEREPAPVLATVFSRDDMRFVSNEPGVRNLAAFHCVYPAFGDRERIRALLAYLNSDLALDLAETQVREYADGLSKFEPGDLSALPTLDVRRLSDDEVARLADLFGDLAAAGRSGDDAEEARVREELDGVLRELLEEHRERMDAERLDYWT